MNLRKMILVVALMLSFVSCDKEGTEVELYNESDTEINEIDGQSIDLKKIKKRPGGNG